MSRRRLLPRACVWLVWSCLACLELSGSKKKNDDTTTGQTGVPSVLSKRKPHNVTRQTEGTGSWHQTN